VSCLGVLTVGARANPTDSVLSNSIVKSKFADTNIPRGLQRTIVADSGANDGLSHSFLFLPLSLNKYAGHPEQTYHYGGSKMIDLWFDETWDYTTLLSVVYGAAIEHPVEELLHWAEKKKSADTETLLVFAIALTVIGSCHRLQLTTEFDSSPSLEL
jgi:NhaP-type Na+/H+ or K+/H+ antiporter